MLQFLRNIKLWWNIFVICEVAYAIVCLPGQIIQQMTKDADVASQYQSTRVDPRPNCIFNVPTWCTSRGDLRWTMCVFCSSTSRLSLLWRNKLCLLYIVLKPQHLPAIAMSTISLELHYSEHESSKMCRCLVQLFFKELLNSKFTPSTNWGFLISFNIISYSRLGCW